MALAAIAGVLPQTAAADVAALNPPVLTLATGNIQRDGGVAVQPDGSAVIAWHGEQNLVPAEFVSGGARAHVSKNGDPAPVATFTVRPGGGKETIVAGEPGRTGTGGT
jgi:hypothetical protein